MTSPYTRGPPLSHCPQLLIQQICSCLPHLKTYSTISVQIQACKTHTVKAGTVALKRYEVLGWIYYNYVPSSALISTTILYNLKQSRLEQQSHSRLVLRRCLILILATTLAILPYFCGFPYCLCINAATVPQLDMPTSKSLPLH
jgi:hypothetical protein